jgi:hypothetical protein
MSTSINPEVATALVSAQGVTPTADSAADDARFASMVLANSAKAFAQLAFEDEPSGYSAAQKRNAR